MADLVRLDLACGPRKHQGFWGVDREQFPGVDQILDLSVYPWPWDDASVDEVVVSHYIEHLTSDERVKFFNELYRVLKPNAKARIVTPHWSNERAYGDPTHLWPPVTGWTYYYMNKGWRDQNATYVGYICDFDFALAGSHDQDDAFLATRNLETKMMMMSRWLNCCTELICTLTRRPNA